MGFRDVSLLFFGCPNHQLFLPTAGFRAWCQNLAKIIHAGPLVSIPLPNIWRCIQIYVLRWAGTGPWKGDRGMALAPLVLVLLFSAQGQVLREVQAVTSWIFSGRNQVLIMVELQPALHDFFHSAHPYTNKVNTSFVNDFPRRWKSITLTVKRGNKISTMLTAVGPIPQPPEDCCKRRWVTPVIKLVWGKEDGRTWRRPHCHGVGMPYEGIAGWFYLAYSWEWPSWHLQGPLELQIELDLETWLFHGAVATGNSWAHPCSKKGTSRVFPPQRCPCKEMRVKGRRFGGIQADKKAGRLVQCSPSHFSNILCVTSLALLSLLPNMEKIHCGCKMGESILNESKHGAMEASLWGRRFCLFIVEGRGTFCPSLFNILISSSKI